MSENETQPVVWDLTYELGTCGDTIPSSYDITPCPGGRFVHIDDFHSAIDRLTSELNVAVSSLANAQSWRRVWATASHKAELDAERYRWLRDKAMMGSRHDPAVLKDGPTDCCEFMFGEELDAAIDAAMAESQP